MTQTKEEIADGTSPVICCRHDWPGRQPVAGGRKIACGHCAAVCMISPTNYYRLTSRSVVLCLDCALAAAEAEQS